MGIDLGFELDERVLKWGGVLVAEVVIVTILSVFIIVPQIARIEKATRDLAKEQKSLNDLQRKIELLADFQIEFTQQAEVLESVFPLKRDVGLVVTSLRQLSTNTNMELVTYNVHGAEASSRGRSASTVPSLAVELTINGSAEGTSAFIDAINSSLPLKSIENLQVVRNLVATGSAQVEQFIQTKLLINSYYLPFDIKVDATKPLDPFGERQTAALNELAGYTRAGTVLEPILSAPATPNPNLFAE